MLIPKICANYGAHAMSVLGLGGYTRYVLTSIAQLPSILSERSLRPVDRAMRGTIPLKHSISGSQCLIDLDSYRAGDIEEDSYAFGLVREIWLRNIYLANFALPEQLGCVVDLGANRGIFALQAAVIAKQVIAVEALDKYGRLFAHNLALNHRDNVEWIQAMVGSEALVSMESHVTLDLAQVLSRATVPIDLLKIDIEGSEFGLDLGAAADVKRIAMELHPRWGDPGKLVGQVAALGFDCRTFDDSMAPVAPAGADFLFAINLAHADARWSAA
jgi:hypothetical protein